MSIPTRRLGRTDLQISALGFGAWAAGGPDWAYGWGPQDDADSIAAIRAAVESGVTWIDTPAVYGRGHSEDVVRRALHGIPAADRPLIFTKGGVVAPADGGPPRLVGQPESLRAEVDASLSRLGVETIDLYQIHWPSAVLPEPLPWESDGTGVAEAWGALQELKTAGKIRHLGLSNHGVDLLDAAHRQGPVESIQPPFSAIRREAADTVLPWARAHDTGVIVYSPMQSGLLSGAMDEQRVATLPENDWRRSDEEFRPPRLARNLALAKALARVGERHGVSSGAVAVAWTLAWPGVTGAIVGARNAEHVAGWSAAASLALTADDLGTIATTLSQTGAGTGPTAPPA